MREQIEQWIRQSLDALCREGTLNAPPTPRVVPAKSEEHGDWASNVALTAAKGAGIAPMELAARIVEHLPATDVIDKVEVASPGFINFYIKQGAETKVLSEYLNRAHPLTGAGEGGQRVLLEFVSANPTGPLHVGHGRGAAYGACIASLLKRQGCRVECEYYINDAGRQMDVLTLSVWLRYLALGDSTEWTAFAKEHRYLCNSGNQAEHPGDDADAEEDEYFPAGAYRGDYVWDVAADVRRKYGDALQCGLSDDVFGNLPTGRPDPDDKDAAEARLTALIGVAKTALGDQYESVYRLALEAMSRDIKSELERFGVCYERWFSESSLRGRVDEVVVLLEKAGCLYTKDGALWFQSARYGDEKDRVIRRKGGEFTYFATDIAYHLDKYRRGYDRMINIWGADHHGYIARLKAALSALGLDVRKLEIVLVQFVNLWRDGKRLAMSTRAGKFVPLRELRSEVGIDAARFFYVTRKPGQHIDFDLSLAKSQSSENPVYYIQYAHARICSVFRRSDDRDDRRPDFSAADTSRLDEEDEVRLMKMLADYDGILEDTARRMEPHHLIQFLRDLANAFHIYYNHSRFLIDDVALQDARLLLISAVRDTIADGLHLLGVSAPENM